MADLGKVQWILDVDTSKGEAKLRSFRGEITGASEDGNKSFLKLGAIAGATAAIVGNVLTSAIEALQQSIGDAVRRVDTLSNADRVFANMGFSVEATDRAMKSLEESITGLPTPLDSAVRGVQILSGTIGDIEKSQQVFTALNNAVLGFGGTASQVEGAVAQLSQLPLDGPLDAQTWNSLRNNGLTPVFNALAKESGVSMGELRNQFSTGQLTVEDFNDMLVKLNKEGGGGLQSLEKIAKDSTSGIETGFANMQTAITRGMAKIIQAIGPENISKSISNTGRIFEQVLTFIASAFTFVTQAIQALFTWLQPLFDWIGQNQQAFDVLKTTLLILGGVLLGTVMAAIIIVTVAIAAIIGIIQFLIDSVESLIQWFINFGNNVRIVSQLAWSAIQSAFGNVANWFRDRFNEAWNAVRGAFAQFGGWIMSRWNDIVNAFGRVGSWFRDRFNEAWNNIKAVFGGIGQWFSNLGSALYNAGRDIINGLINGIKSAAGGVRDSIINIAKNSLDAIKNFFGIHSPSRVMADQGEFLMEGLANGIVDAGRGVIKAVQDVNSSIANEMTAAEASMSSDITGRVSTMNGAMSMAENITGLTGQSTGATVNQVNNFYNADEPNMEKVNDDLTWNLNKL